MRDREVIPGRVHGLSARKMRRRTELAAASVESAWLRCPDGFQFEVVECGMSSPYSKNDGSNRPWV